MELVTGEPLTDLLEREPVLPEQRLLPVLAQTARALHAAHAGRRRPPRRQAGQHPARAPTAG